MPWLERVVGFCDRHGIARGTLLEVGPGFGTRPLEEGLRRAYQSYLSEQKQAAE